MKVTFDSNVWEKVVVPERFPNDARFNDLLAIQEAIRSGRIEGFIAETVATIEAIPKRLRNKYLASRESPIYVEPEKSTGPTLSFTVRIEASPSDHPGLSPVLRDRLEAAYQLGFKIIPSSRIGTVRPPEILAAPRIPLTKEQQEDVWPLLQRISDTIDAIEARGIGRARLEKIAQRIQGRLAYGPDAAWFDGLDKPLDESERAAISLAFAEWADGDSVGLHVGYGLDYFCTEDHGRTDNASVLNEVNREWLFKKYGVKFITIAGLSEWLR